jgi:alpha-ketoglutarate-dependent 2,4-dichlorophenoxyacetate dioxygenase
MKISPLHDEFGAVIEEIDLANDLAGDSGEAPFRQIDEAINQYSVLLFRGQSLNDETHIAFTRRFGPLEENHVEYYTSGAIAYIGKIGNIDADGNQLKNQARKVVSQTANNMWHSDSSFRENPSLHSLLYAYEVPAEGGETEFVSARAAYQRLDQQTRDQIDNAIGIHDYIYSRTKVGEDAVSEGQRTYMRPVRQRLVRRNPHTGDKNYYVGSHVRDIEGMSSNEGKALIDRLMIEATRAESVYRHHWQAGDLVIWDNRCVLHRGAGYDADKYRRLLHQTRVRGLGPTLAE